MAAMLVFTLVMNIVGWGVFALTDVFLGAHSFVHFVMLAEWFVVPMAASAVYRRVTDADHLTETRDKIMYMLMWFVLSTGAAGVICKCVDMGRWLPKISFNRFEYFSYAFAFVIGFVIYSAAYEIIGFFVDRGFAERRIAKG